MISLSQQENADSNTELVRRNPMTQCSYLSVMQGLKSAGCIPNFASIELDKSSIFFKEILRNSIPSLEPLV